MQKSAAQLLEEALQLPEDQRVEIAYGLLDSLDSDRPGAERSEQEWIAEIERRARAVVAGAPGIPWEDVKAVVSRRLARR